MDSWLQQVSAASRRRTSNESAAAQLRRHREEFARCTPMVRDNLKLVATTYWPKTPRRCFRISSIPTPETGASNTFTRIWNRFRNFHGWRIRNTRTKELFDVYLVKTSKGFCFELPDDYRTEGTSLENLQDALCKAALSGPISYPKRRTYEFL